jgi:hypothetical protein
MNQDRKNNIFPLQGWVGLGLVAIFWPLNWFLEGPRSHWAFFFLWTGFSLVVDGLVYKRTGTSLLTRSWRQYLGLFLFSAPAWWLFEALNWRVQNWVYVGKDFLGNWGYMILSTVAFSTVIPAVFGTAELVGSARFFQKPRPGPVIKPDQRTTMGFFLAGWVMLILLLAWPKIFFPFMWLSIYFILEPLNVWLGNRNLAQWTQTGDWRPILALWGGVLVTGFFWEFWNFWSYPKWVYSVPYLDFLHIFEMPVLGYGGYLPFALELFALYNLVSGLLGDQRISYLRIVSQSEPAGPASSSSGSPGAGI